MTSSSKNLADWKPLESSFLPALISIIARDIILTLAEFAVDFGPNYVDPSDGIKVIDKVKTRWVQQFMAV
ncbi:hypothetical protein CCR75_008937 [Bremia lactucae]|uniref:Uncharacterized protein n=1 Tax=Bremia lactucae TaxID=4779 RepID=A0A976P003_BRELC|nr:hypothetical protein CCR75_008937 [Bremia lactucae]